MPQLVLTAIGLDRPGLVDQLSKFLLDAGGNVADARMVNLRGQFAVLMLVDAEDTAVAAIRRDAGAAGQRIGLSISLVDQAGVRHAPPAGIPYRLKTYAMDQPGIVHRITHVLHRQRVNIEELQTRLEAGAYSGTPLFTMELRLTVPTDVSINALRRELESLCEALNCDLDLQPA